MKAELFNLVLLGQYLVVPLVAIRYLGFMDHMFYYLFAYFKGEKIPGLFFSSRLFPGDFCVLWSKMPVKAFATKVPERLQFSLTWLHAQTWLAGSW